jgi:uncharacterized protein GlcG (DUF336 family)
MPSKKSYLNQSDVAKILAAADAHAQKNNWEVSISVVDDGGHLLGFVRRDNAPPISTYISQEKAKAAALGKRESKVYEDVINNGRFSFINATAMVLKSPEQVLPPSVFNCHRPKLTGHNVAL